MVKPSSSHAQPIAPTVADPDQLSYYRWLSFVLERFRNMCRSEEIISDKIAFMHRPIGQFPLPDEEINNKIDRAMDIRERVFRELGKKENESLDRFHQRMTEGHRHRVAIKMAELGAVHHWQPPIQDYGLRNKPNPRRPMTEQAMSDRMKDADSFVGGFL